MNRPDAAVDCFSSGFNCSQAILSTYCGEYGLDRGAALRIALGFGGGMGRTQGACGAYTGSLMVLGLIYGGDGPFGERKDRCYAAIQEFTRRFRERNKSIYCTDLLGCDLSTPEGREKAKARDVHTTLCSKYVRDAAEILEEMLA